MRAALALVVFMLLSGCSSPSSVDAAQAMRDWSGLQEDAGHGGDLSTGAGRTTLAVPDYGMLLALAVDMEWFVDGWRLDLAVTEAHFGGEDQSEDFAGLSVRFLCVPGTVSFSSEGMEAFGGEDADSWAGHDADCLDAADRNKVAAAFRQLAGDDFPLEGIESMLAFFAVPDVDFVSGSEKGGARTNTYRYDLAGVFTDVTASVRGDRVQSLALHSEADGATLDSALVLRYGPRSASP